jgi:hypothetical protein
MSVLELSLALDGASYFYKNRLATLATFWVCCIGCTTLGVAFVPFTYWQISLRYVFIYLAAKLFSHWSIL